jgi:hypothetical protein
MMDSLGISSFNPSLSAPILLPITVVGVLLCGCPGTRPLQAPRSDGFDLSFSSEGFASSEARSADRETGSTADILTSRDSSAAALKTGCSDGTREGFADTTLYASIAGCSGGWSVIGVKNAAGVQCSRVAGNSSSNPTGSGCAADDLCAKGWHICATSAEVSTKSGGSCSGITTTSDLFFVTRQSGTGNMLCESSGSNDLFGCGTVGDAPDSTTCAPLDRFSNNLCASLSTDWDCGGDVYREAENVRKAASAGGGVLCCKD